MNKVMLFVDLSIMYSIMETRCKVIENDPANNLKVQTVSLGMPLHGTEEMWKETSCSSTSQPPVSVIHHSVELLSLAYFQSFSSSVRWFRCLSS